MKSLFLFFSLWVFGCSGGRDVGFSSSKNPGGDDGTSLPVVSEQSKPPQVNITHYPKSHILGGSAQLGFEVVVGDNPISTLGCYLDDRKIGCERDSGRLVFDNLQEGKHIFKVEVADTTGLGANNQASWIIYRNGADYQKRGFEIQVGMHDKEVDILFVVDNSASMYDEQQGIANRISNLFSKINELDWRLGIITTDPYEFTPKEAEYNPLADGALLGFPDGSYHLHSGLDTAVARDLFSRTIYRPEVGNGHERGIHNVYRAIERSLDPSNEVNQRLQSFFRHQASLNVILISDEDETLVDGVGTPLANQMKGDGANLVSFINSQWPEKAFQFNSVIVQPGDKNKCSDGDKNEKVGQAYFNLSQLTGGVAEDICAKDYGKALDNIGAGVANLRKSYVLDCEPIDINGDGQVDINVVGANGRTLSGYQLNGRVIQFDQLLETGDYDIIYFCQTSP